MLRLRSAPILIGTAGIALFGTGMPGSVFGASAKRSISVVANGLNNPRGLAIVRGQLYVAEAGTGGSDCPAGAKSPEGGPLCFGRTGAIAVVSHGVARPVVSGLISESGVPGGLAAGGVAAVTGTSRGLRAVYGGAVAGIPPGAKLNAEDAAAANSELGRLVSVTNGQQKSVAAVGDADYRWSETHKNLAPNDFPDANPNALAVVGSTTYVIDAASNTLDSVDNHGKVRQLVYIPNVAMSDAVPTCVAFRGGNLYIGELAPGAPLNGGSIYRYNIRRRSLSVWKHGFNVVDGCGFDSAGNFYAVEFQATGFNPGPMGNPAGDIIEIGPNGKRTVLGAGKLFYPQGFAADGRGNIYVSNWSILPGTAGKPGMPTGQIVRVNR